MSDGRLAGRRVLVTGGARGLGLAIVERVVAEGGAVALVDLDLAAATEVAEKLSTAAAPVVPIEGDVRSEASVAGAVAAGAKELGGLDGLVNNAGIVRDGPLERMTLADWDDVLEIDLRGYFLCCREAAPHLREAAGSIVNVSSRAYLGNPGQANYSAAKAGVVGLTRALSMELGPAGVRVNAVAPGVIDTDLVRLHPKADAIRARAEKSTPLRRLGRPAEVGSVAAFLLSEDASYLTGEVLHVTGGRR